MRILSPALLAVLLLSASSGAQAAPTLLDVVAKAELYESERVGYGDVLSSKHAALWQFAVATPTPDLLRLLSHKNPVVRAYAAVYLAAERPQTVGSLLPILQDERPIRKLEGCEGGTTLIRQLVLGALLRHPQHRAVQDLLLTMLKTYRFRHYQGVFDSLIRYRAPEVLALLRDLVSRRDPEWRIAATLIFRAISRQPESTPLSGSAFTLPWLGALLVDPSNDVRAAAIRAAGEMYENRPDEVPGLLQSRDPAVRRVAIYGLGEAASERSLPMLAAHFAQHPTDIPNDDTRPFAVSDRSTTNHVVFMRAMLSVPNRRRYLVIRRLHKFRDQESAVAIRPFLRSPVLEERLEAIRAVGGLSDAPVADGLLPFLASARHDERLAAVLALAELCLPQHASAISAAVAREPIATAPELKRSLEQRLLRCPPPAPPAAQVQPSAATTQPH